MRVPLLLLADYANVADGGKLNIMGVFSNVWSSVFPAQHPRMYVVFQVEDDPAERGRKRKLEVIIQGEDGQKIFGVQGDFAVAEDQSAPGAAVVPGIVELAGLIFKDPGHYQVCVLLDEDIKGRYSFRVLKKPGAPTP